MDINLDFYNNGAGQRVAHFEKGGVHLTVSPHTVLEDGALKNLGFEVSFYGDKNGQVDVENGLNSIVIKGSEEDLEEIADTYAQRLEGGIKPEHMFDDIIEKNRESTSEIKAS